MAGPSGATSRLTLPYPIPSDTADVPRDVRALAEKLDTDVTGVITGAGSARPAPGVAGRFFYNTTIGQLDYDNGTAWESATIPKLVTLPNANLYNNQRCIWVPDMTTFGPNTAGFVMWDMVYNTNNSLWWFLGGQQGDTTGLPTWTWTPGATGTIVNWVGAPALTIPNAGNWQISVPPFAGRLSSAAVAGSVELFNFGLAKASAWVARQEYGVIGPWCPFSASYDYGAPFSVGDVVRPAVAYSGGTGQKYDIGFLMLATAQVSMRFVPQSVSP